MENELVQSRAIEKKIFESGCGSKFNCAFVPAIINKLYQQYVKVSATNAPKIIELQNKAKSEAFLNSVASDPRLLENHNRAVKRLTEKLEEVNLYGKDIMMKIIKKNIQDFDHSEMKDKQIWDYICENMSIQDQADFIVFACVGNAVEQKKN